MKNKLKIPCPYQSSCGNCTHKAKVIETINKKCWCGYNKPTHCMFYLEWIEKIDITSLEEKSLLDPLKLKLRVFDK